MVEEGMKDSTEPLRPASVEKSLRKLTALIAELTTLLGDLERLLNELSQTQDLPQPPGE
jgi:hypothetical protein